MMVMVLKPIKSGVTKVRVAEWNEVNKPIKKQERRNPLKALAFGIKMI